MTPGTLTAMAPSPLAGRPWRLWVHQLRIIVGLELRKRAADRRSLWVVALAFAPVLLMGTMVVQEISRGVTTSMGEVVEGYAYIFESLILHGVVFLGCVGIFTALFRGEVLQGSLHYYFLAPVRREIVVVGKYLSGLLVVVPVFALATVLSTAITYVPFAPPSLATEDLWALVARHGLLHLEIVVLACLGYGAVFLVMGLFFRNPIIPGAVILGWEYINFLLPPVLKKLSIVYYLRSLSPVRVSEGPFALLADPASPWIAVPGLLVLTVLLVAVAAVGARRVEIDYGGE